MEKNDVTAGGLLLAFFGYGLFTAMSFPEKSRYFPFFVCCAGLLLSLILLISAVVRMKKGVKTEAEALDQDAVKVIAFTGVAILLYCIAMQYIGFCVATAVFMVVLSARLYPGKLSMENKTPLLIIGATSLIVTALIYVVFKMLLYVPLPSGLLF